MIFHDDIKPIITDGSCRPYSFMQPLPRPWRRWLVNGVAGVLGVGAAVAMVVVGFMVGGGM